MKLAAANDTVSVLDRWSAWLPLWDAGADVQLPAEPGLYRIR
jgi:hypothetical protein